MRALEVQPADDGRDQAPIGLPGAPTDLSVEANPDMPRGELRRFALASLTAISIALCAALALPVLPAITWAVALAILAWPMHRRIARRVARPGPAAAISTAILVTAILGTLLSVTYPLARETAAAVERVGEVAAPIDVRGEAVKLPVVGRVVGWMERTGLDVEGEVRHWIGSYTHSVTELAQGSVAAVGQLLVAVFILFYLFRDHENLLLGIRKVLPLSRAESGLVLSRAGDSIHANLTATVVTSLIDTISFGFLFWSVGLPLPLLWASVMLVLSLVPLPGPGAVWIPAAAYLALTGQWGPAAAVLGWGVFTLILVDNLMYLRLAGDRMQLHEVPALVALLGGLSLFGVSGIILGPVTLAVAAALLEVWKGRSSKFD
jgi:predicted PurR-regulated permease PerM